MFREMHLNGQVDSTTSQTELLTGEIELIELLAAWTDLLIGSNEKKIITD